MRIGIAGLGRMGTRHLQVALQGGHEVVALYDTHPEAASRAAAEQSVPSSVIVKDEKRIWDRRPECLIVATTAPSHEFFVTTGAQRGVRYVLCEKPIAGSLASARRMIDGCKAAGVSLAVNHQMRFMEQYTKIREIIEGKQFGGWSSITAVTGNFGLAMNGVHYFELFRWLSGEPAETVTAWLSTEKVPNPRGTQFEDVGGSVRIETASGKRFYLEASTEQGHGIKVTYAGRTGLAVADELLGTIDISYRSAADHGLPTTRYGCPAEIEVASVAPADVLQPTAAVLEALLLDGDYPTGEDGAAALQILVAAHISHGKGNVPIRLAEGLPEDLTLPIA